MTENECTVIQYHRRNDRTPEKDFDRREETNKKLTSEVRRAVERARSKITDLQDDVDERDVVVETERTLRIAAENRLQEHLVDPYKSPEVNHELRQRLPRSKKDDPKLSRSDQDQEDDLIENPGEIIEDMESQQVTKTDRPPSPDQVGHTKSASQVKRALDFKGAERPRNDNSDSSKSFINKNIIPLTHSNIVGFPQYVSMPQTPVLYRPGLTSSFSPAGAYSYNLTSPRNPLRTPTGAPKVQNNDQQDDQSEKMDTSLSVSELHTEELPPQETTRSQQPQPQQSFFRLPSHTMNGYPSPIRSSSFLPNHSPMYQPTSITESVLPSYSSHLSPSDQNRQVALLLSELDAAKSQNKKLMEKMINIELDLETERLKAKVREADEKGHTDASVAAGMVQEVHKSQRRKEEAMMGRIKVANQERDESMFRLSEMERRYEESFSRDRSDSGDMEDELDLEENFDHLMSRVGQYDFPNVHEYNSLAQKLEQMKQRQREIASDEMQAILEQRDLALAKARKLEEELIKRQREDTFNNSNSEQNLLAELDIVKKERELALAKVRQLKDENETIRIYYSLHKSLSQESIHQVNNTLHVNQSKLKENNTLVAELQDATVHRDQLQADLDKRDRKLEETAAQIKKLERLVTVLRKKLRHTDSSEDITS
ncbi:mirror-image polydactyly gene 1 protein-like isoform X1 [Mytilus edulis]|uniref:mirror-image polydactyly gene 1 protein-like isoform X1 n=2 Tax=Mytilus edulis TaxID=6550 RepID=UPI0039EE8005